MFSRFWGTSSGRRCAWFLLLGALPFAAWSGGFTASAPSQQSAPWRTAAPPKADADGFVLIRGGTFWSGDIVTRKGALALSRVEDFEICDHPVTHGEYRRFVAATGFEPPPHWKGRNVPVGMENFPVIFVNRYDVDAYLAWRTKVEGRIARLPTDAEFEYAARGGLERKLYSWGDDPPQNRGNFDSDGTRAFDSWARNLKPVRSYPPNGYNLYDMTGNVWQMTETHPEPGQVSYKFRILTPSDLEGRITGGSWARTEAYLRCGSGAGASPGIRHPDLGFRIVREPAAGSPAFRTLARRLAALPAGSGKVFLSWQWLPSDPPAAGFNIYRSRRRDDAGFLVNASPVSDSTNYLDTVPQAGSRYQYRVRAVLADGKEGPSSEWAGVDPAANPDGLAGTYAPAPRKTGGAPGFGDLDGDGLLDLVIRLDNGNVEMSKDPGLPVELEAFLGNGRYLWRRPLVWHDFCFGSASDVPVNLYDLDGDGQAEVICRLQEGETVYLAVLEGLTGKVLRKTPWPKMLTDFAKSSTRIHLSVAFLDGKHAALITQTGLYENELFTAFDADLNRLWEFRSLMETSGSGSHHIDIADVDGDGRDEIFDGTTCLNPDGTLRWSLYRGHPDIVAIRDFLPERPGLEVYYVIETSAHAGAYMVDASTGKILWVINRESDPRWTHGHVGWAADIWAGSPGAELYANRDGHPAKETLLISALGKILLEPFPSGLLPLEWDGDPVRELISRDGKSIGKFDGRQLAPVTGVIPNASGRGSVVMVADLVGDFRDEIVVAGTDAAGLFSISIYSPTALIHERKPAAAGRHDYQMWLAHNLIGGYGSYFEP